jgi:hypothetical protein
MGNSNPPHRGSNLFSGHERDLQYALFSLFWGKEERDKSQKDEEGRI